MHLKAIYIRSFLFLLPAKLSIILTVASGLQASARCHEQSIALSRIDTIPHNPPNSVIDISGKIVNENSESLGGVTVTARKSNKATATDSDGKFFLRQIDKNDILAITSVGYYDEEIPLEGRATLQIKLHIKANRLDETVVIAYGTTTRRLNTGSIHQITSDVIDKQPVSNPLAALQGRVPGLIVNSTSGMPGASFTVQIRGQNSINSVPGGSRAVPLKPLDQPLFIVDGVPFVAQNANINLLSSIAAPGGGEQFNNIFGGISPFNNINPADIESIEVLKDADATAIYGSRGANGVILITTKRGNAGKMKVSVNAYTGASQIARTMEMMNTTQYRQMRREAFGNDGIVPSTTLISSNPGYAPDLLIFDSVKFTDWKKYFLGKTANNTQVNTSVTGGSQNTNFLLGAGYGTEAFIFPGNFNAQRISSIFNFHHHSPDKRLGVEFGVNYSYYQNNSPGSPNSLFAFTLPPNYPDPVDASGNLVWSYKGVPLNDNPLAYLKQINNFKSYYLTSHFQTSYEIFSGFTLRANFGYNNLTSRENLQIPKASLNPNNTPVSMSNFAATDRKAFIIEPQIEYSKKIQKSRITVLLGGTYQHDDSYYTSINGTSYLNDALLGSVSAAATKTVADGFSEYKYTAAFARINYSYNHRYVVNISGRRDGSSRFGPARQFGNFGSAGLGWIFSDEGPVKKALKFLSYGKLRASYGIRGSDAIGDYGYIARWGVSSNVLGLSFQGNNGYVPLNLFNADFSWAVSKTVNLGSDLSFLKDRLQIGLEWYYSTTGNQLISYQLPSQVGGFDNVIANFPAVIQNKGWELTVNANLTRSRKFTWSAYLNLSFPKNKLTSFPDFDKSSYRFTYVVGQSTNVVNAFKFAGVDPATGIYQFYKSDGTPGNNPIRLKDFYIAGDLDPQYFGGLNNSFKYKGVQVDLFLEFKKQKGSNYLQQIYSNYPAGSYGNLPTMILGEWKAANDNTTIQKFTSQRYATPAGIAALNYAFSDAAFSDASYVRLKTVSISYKIPDHIIKKAKMQGFKVYANCQNVFTLTNYMGNDPETKSFYSLPPVRTISAGVQLTF